MGPPILLAFWISPSNLGRVLSNLLDVLAPSLSSNLDLFFAKQIAFPRKSLSGNDFVDLKVFRLAPRTLGAGPTPALVAQDAGSTPISQKKLKLSEISTLAYSVLLSLFLVSTFYQSTFLFNSISAYIIASIE